MTVISHKAYARAGFIGNPSDGYGGKTIAFIVKNFAAQVTLSPAERIEFVAGASDLNRYETVYALRDDVVSHGYYGGISLFLRIDENAKRTRQYSNYTKISHTLLSLKKKKKTPLKNCKTAHPNPHTRANN